jgi:hypothetical protein
MDATGNPVTRRTAAFTLTEVLVAVSLVAVIGTLALLLLQSTGNVAREIGEGHPPAHLQVLNRLERDLLHLIPSPPGDPYPSFSLEKGEILKLTTLRTTPEGLRIPAICLYQPEGRVTLRIEQIPNHTAVTNRLDMLRSPLRFALTAGERSWADWPQEEKDQEGSRENPPVLLTVSGTTTTDQTFTHRLALPSQLRVERGAAEEDPEDGQ